MDIEETIELIMEYMWIDVTFGFILVFIGMLILILTSPFLISKHKQVFGEVPGFLGFKNTMLYPVNHTVKMMVFLKKNETHQKKLFLFISVLNLAGSVILGLGIILLIALGLILTIS